MSPGVYDDLLAKITPFIQKEDTKFRKAISPGLRLSITLRFLATGMI
jgi:3-hydroxymyristoyl/3-hydroxydecanoyl-(acyl carrier protein) dehydratase